MKIYKVHVASTISDLENQVNTNLKKKDIIGSPFIHNGDFYQAAIEDVPPTNSKPLDSDHINFF